MMVSTFFTIAILIFFFNFFFYLNTLQWPSQGDQHFNNFIFFFISRLQWQKERNFMDQVKTFICIFFLIALCVNWVGVWLVNDTMIHIEHPYRKKNEHLWWKWIKLKFICSCFIAIFFFCFVFGKVCGISIFSAFFFCRNSTSSLDIWFTPTNGVCSANYFHIIYNYSWNMKRMNYLFSFDL